MNEWTKSTTVHVHRAVRGFIVFTTLASSVVIAAFSIAPAKGSLTGPCCDEGPVMLLALSIALPASWLVAALVSWRVASARGGIAAWLTFPACALSLAAALPRLAEMAILAPLEHGASVSDERGHPYCLVQECYGTDVTGTIPRGGARLTGTLLLDDRPLADAELRLMTADRKVTGSATTDERGDYAILLPAGTYSFTRVWLEANLQPAHHTLVSGHERRLGREIESASLSYRPSRALRVTLGTGRRVRQDFALHGNPRPHAMAPISAKAMPEGVSLEWQPVAGARTYEVVIAKPGRGGPAEDSHPPLVRLRSEVAGARLERFLERAPEGTIAAQYDLAIHAFDAEGDFVSEHRGGLRLPAGWAIAETCGVDRGCAPAPQG